MPKEQTVIALGRALVKQAYMTDADDPARLAKLSKPGSAVVVDLDNDMWGVNFATDMVDPDKGCKTWKEVATHVFRNVEAAISCESVTDVILCTTIKSPPLKERVTAVRKRGHVFITNDPNRRHIVETLPKGFYPNQEVKIKKKDVHYDSRFKMHYLVFLTSWLLHHVKLPPNCSITLFGGALYMNVTSGQLVTRMLDFSTDEMELEKETWQPVFLDRPLQLFHEAHTKTREVRWMQTVPPYLKLIKAGNRMSWEMLATTDADLWTSFASAMLQAVQTKEHTCIVSANDRDQFNILLLRADMHLLLNRATRPAKQTTYYMHPISLGSYQGHPNMCTEYVDMSQVAVCFGGMAERWLKEEDGQVVIPSPRCMIFALLAEIRGGDYTLIYPQRIAFEDYYSTLVREHAVLSGMVKYYPDEVDEQNFPPHINTKMHIDIDYAKFHRFICLSQDTYRKRMGYKDDNGKSENKIDDTKLRVQVANLIWVLYLEANCWKCNTLPLNCYEKVDQNGQQKSLYGWKKDMVETVPTQDDNIAIYSVYSSNPAARR